MEDIIHLLSDNIANQIAAGEVVQRPASIVKELVENAIDAAAQNITLHLTNAGLTQIQVIDDGFGMTENDARLCFEKHATSKIKKINDIYQIHTMGFRGEALAAISAVCKVTLKTRTAGQNIGTAITIENSTLIRQEPCATAKGTDITAKNLFFSVPARKNFLKSPNIENHHNYEEFIRTSLAHPNITFLLYSDMKNIYHLRTTSSFKKRIVQIFGTKYDTNLLPLELNTDYVKIKGFIGKPEIGKKKGGEQFFFINKRFIKHSLLHHAIQSCYTNLLPEKSRPFYALQIEIDPAKIDINIHPTKQEIKFEDEKIIYSYLKSGVQQTLNTFALHGSINFNLASEIQTLPAVHTPSIPPKTPVKNSPLYQTYTQKNQAHFIDKSLTSESWKTFYSAPLPTSSEKNKGNQNNTTSGFLAKDNALENEIWQHKQYLQIRKEWILTDVHDGIILIHQQYAHEIILYGKLKQLATDKKKTFVQPLLFPIPLNITPIDIPLFEEIIPALSHIGYEITRGNEQGNFIVHSSPDLFNAENIASDLDIILETYKYATDINEEKNDKLMRCIALKNAIKIGKALTQEEMQTLTSELFSQSSRTNYLNFPQKPFIILTSERITNFFNNAL